MTSDAGLVRDNIESLTNKGSTTDFDEIFNKSVLQNIRPKYIRIQ